MGNGVRRITNHRQLEAFQAVMEAGSVTAAAERMLITQPAVSRLIRDLEQGLGFELFERRKGRLTATVEARFLHEEVQRSFMGLDKIIQIAGDIRTLNAGSLRIAAMPALAYALLPRVIGKFSAAHPNVGISLQIRSSAKVLEWIASQQFDVGFAATQQTHLAVEQEPLLDARFVTVLPARHRLRDKPLITPRDLENENFISLGPELDVRRKIDEIFAEAGVARHLTIDSQLSFAVCTMVASGIGVSLVEPVTASEFLDRGIVMRPFEPELRYQYDLLFPLYRARSKAARRFIEMVRSELAAMPMAF
jgi:DNA-binding transcriptional LysR family regulator